VRRVLVLLPALSLALASWRAALASDAAEKLAAAIRLPTVSHQDPARFDGKPFLALHELLERSYPIVHRTLRREVVNRYSLLYTWGGGPSERKPVLLTSHLDVVPVPEDQLEQWAHPPFGGVIADGYVWGRGAIDDKVGVTAMLEAAERLAAQGFWPERTVYLAFGHDEEIGGAEGAGGITALLRERGVALELTLDEGLAILENAFPGLEKPVALIGIAEKGYLTLEITAPGTGGHSSTPPPSTAIGRLARAIERLEESPLPARIDAPFALTLDEIGVHLPFPQGFVVRNRWLTGPLLLRLLARDRGTDAMIRTTTAVTMVRAGEKENVLPQTATAIANFRLLPGDSAESVIEHVRRVVDDPEIRIETTTANEPSRVADAESPAYALLTGTLATTHPGALVAPALVLGGTDTKHYGEIAEQSFRFTPMTLSREDLSRLHGVNERLSVSDYERAVAFYVELLRRAAGAP
jgi:carboxypeptidase PM20D1